MREIKFRAWDKEFKKWSEIPLEYSIRDINYYTDYEWNQYTGLKDINGVEIYDGDIVDVANKSYKSRGQIAWSTHTAKWLIAFYNGVPFELGTWNTELYKVIGNIYENPELLSK